MKVVSAFVARRPWATVLVCLIGGPVIGMLYLGRGLNTFAYVAAAVLAVVLSYAAVFFGISSTDPLTIAQILTWFMHVIGIFHGYCIAKKMSGEKPKVWFSRWYSIVVLGLILPTGFALGIRSFLWEPYSIPSRSMLPTLEVGDHLWVSRYAYGYSRYSIPLGLPLFSGRILGAEPTRGDILVYKRPGNLTDYIRRIVGLPGDRIQYRDGRLYINDVRVKREPAGTVGGITRYQETLPNDRQYYILEVSDQQAVDNTQVYTVPEGHYFGLGDNRDNSFDNRFPEQGFIPYENIVGRFEVVFWNSERRKLMFEERP